MFLGAASFWRSLLHRLRLAISDTMSPLTIVRILAFLTGWQTALAYPEEVWKLASLNWEPYSGESLEQDGLAVQKLRKLLETKGIQISIEYLPWKRAQLVALNPEYIGYFPAWPEEVQKGFIPSPPIDWSNISVMQHKNARLNSNQLEQAVKEHATVFVSSYVYPASIHAILDQYPKNAIPVPHENSLLLMLANRRIDLALTDSNVMLHLASQQNIRSVEVAFELVRKPLVIALRDEHINQRRLELLQNILTD